MRERGLPWPHTLTPALSRKRERERNRLPRGLLGAATPAIDNGRSHVVAGMPFAALAAFSFVFFNALDVLP